jgi:hypothetical protein
VRPYELPTVESIIYYSLRQHRCGPGAVAEQLGAIRIVSDTDSELFMLAPNNRQCVFLCTCDCCGRSVTIAAFLVLQL